MTYGGDGQSWPTLVDNICCIQLRNHVWILPDPGAQKWALPDNTSPHAITDL